jgi:hypothetical protein
MNFLLLGIQSAVSVACVVLARKSGIISFRTFDIQDAKAWFPISFLLVSVIYTGSKSLVCHMLVVVEQRLFTSNFLANAAIFEHTSVYHLQKFDHHSYRELNAFQL